jgi:hypothetical protein
MPADEPGDLRPRHHRDRTLRTGAGFTDTLSRAHSGQVLETLAASIGPVPHILLPDIADGTTEPPLVNPATPEMPTPADRSVRVQLLGEIARGGMGVVLKGRDPDLGRDLAFKVLLETHKEKPDLVRRFVEEAQIGGQLQHPGVVPVYELGAFGDRRPYFTMKLVKGQTLADLLADRTSSADELAREAQARAEESRRTAEVAQAKAKAERRARRLTGALAASVLGLIVAVVGGYSWVAWQRSERQARVDLALREAEVLRGAAEQAGNDRIRWRAAREAAHVVDRLLADARGLPTRRRVAALVESVAAAAEAAENDQKLLEKLIDIRSSTQDDPDWSATDAAYAAAFREVGIDVGALPPDEAGARIKTRPARIALALWAALDDWTSVRRDKRRDRPGAERLARPPAPPIPTRGATGYAMRSTPPKARNGSRRCANWPVLPGSTSSLPSASTCSARRCGKRVIRGRPRSCRARPSASTPPTYGSTTI